ncbi:MAG: TetR/AcrR family transcriptional regulator [Candidatus Latescibacterota bacterium]|nr:MAG: TetR/AcrR family transcriptional regulator [Candidatus Latescibacterota bacterium]
MVNASVESSGESERRLLEAAEAVFAERGYHAASTTEIAKRAGLNKTLIHYYFRSKEGLYRALMQRISRQLAPFLEDFSITDPLEALAAATRRYIRLLADNPRYVRLCAYSSLEGIQIMGDEEMHERLVAAANSAIQRGVDQGVFRSEDPRHVLASVEGMCRFFFEHEDAMREQWGDSYERERIVQERCDHVVRILTEGLAWCPDVRADQSEAKGSR